MDKIKVVCYYRVSTKGQGDSGLGLEAQKAYLAHFLKPDSYEIVTEFVEVATAKSINCKVRPLLCEAIKLCVGSGYTLAVAKLDRLSRDTADTLKIFSELGNRLFACDVPSENGKLDEFMLTLIAAFAKRERDLISIRTKQALEVKKVRGEVWNRNSTWTDSARIKGQKTNSAKAATNKNTSRAKDYATMLRNNGKTLEQVAEILNEQNHQTATGKKFDKALVKYLIDK